MSARITLLGSQDSRLREFLGSHPEGHERAAVVLFRRLHLDVPGLSASDRYIAVDVIPFEESWIKSSSSEHVHFELAHLREIFRRCDEEGLVFGFVHNHPQGQGEFSGVDNTNEKTLISAIRNRNGPDVHFVGMLLANGEWFARVRDGSDVAKATTARHVIVLGERILLFGYECSEYDDDHLYSRQAAAFGQPFVDMLRSLRVAFVGGGGTGSPQATLLARAGVGEIVVIDRDTLEKSNLNRVRGAAVGDVGKNKAQVVRDFIAYLGLPVRVAAIEAFVDNDPVAVDALASCDIVFGCTDDQIGREVLNTALYIYAQAFIDVGLGGKVVEDDMGHARLRYHHGRISTILPEWGECLFCQGVITMEWIQHQYALRENPDLTEAEEKERYLQGGGEEAPGVGPFTGAVADYGVATLFDLLRPFRCFPPELRRDSFTIDFVQMSLRSRERKNDGSCPFCGSRDYLVRNERCRLDRPILGKRNVYR